MKTIENSRLTLSKPRAESHDLITTKSLPNPPKNLLHFADSHTWGGNVVKCGLLL